jgi:hypothetical protein
VLEVVKRIGVVSGGRESKLGAFLGASLPSFYGRWLVYCGREFDPLLGFDRIVWLQALKTA